jgi:hypothetical protein
MLESGSADGESTSDYQKMDDAPGNSPKLGDLNVPLSTDFSNPINNAMNGSGDGMEVEGTSTTKNPMKALTSSFDAKVLRKNNGKANFGAGGMLQSVDVRSGKVFREDPASYSLFSTITSPKVQDKVKSLLRGMHEHAEGQQHHMTDQMDYEVRGLAPPRNAVPRHAPHAPQPRASAADARAPRPQDILGKGILYKGEYLVDGLAPMRLKTLDMAKAEVHFPAARALVSRGVS